MGFVVFSAIIFPNCGFITEKRRYFISAVPFEKEKWKSFDVLSNADSNFNLRPKMARYLTENKILIKKSRGEVYEMLGNQNEQRFSESKNIYYELQDFYRSIDPVAIELLVITFDNEDKVEKAEIEFRKTSDWTNF